MTVVLDESAGGIDTPAGGRDLVAALLAHPWGHTSPSVYETGRLVSRAPWLPGHAARLEFVTGTQRPDGGWGGPDGYGLVPTLSATEALLSAEHQEAEQPSRDAAARARLLGAAQRGVDALFTMLDEATATSLPDTPAIEIITPALVALVNDHLDRLGAHGRGRRLGYPAGMDDSQLRMLRQALVAGHDVADKLQHSLEILGDAAGRMSGVEPAIIGAGECATVGASPASTAAWLAARGLTNTEHPARRFLDTVVSYFDGPVPSVFPISVFECGWVLNALTNCGFTVNAPPALITGLAAALGPGGAPGGPGLPADADSTSMALLTLSQLDRPRGVELLRPFETDTHFLTWAGERTPSPSVNAHVLDAFGFDPAGAQSAWHTAVIEKTSSWLRGVQLPEGCWQDKWHASAYYATVRCALALDRHGGAESVHAVRRAVDWVLATQQPDGSWGRWDGTAEETSYALQILLLTSPAAIPAIAPAAARGYRYLRECFDEPAHPALWHDKDLYLPDVIVRANVLGAMHVAQRDPIVAALLTTASNRGASVSIVDMTGPTPPN